MGQLAVKSILYPYLFGGIHLFPPIKTAKNPACSQTPGFLRSHYQQNLRFYTSQASEISPQHLFFASGGTALAGLSKSDPAWDQRRPSARRPRS